MGKTNSPDWRRLSIRVPEHLHRKLRISAALEGVTIRNFILAYLESLDEYGEAEERLKDTSADDTDDRPYDE